MKKFLALFLAVLMMLSIVACSSPDAGTTGSSGASSQASSEGKTDASSGSGSVNGGGDVVDDFGDPTAELALKYDDRHTFAAEIEDILTLSVTSKQSGTETADEAVIKVKSDTEKSVAIACGVGQAKVRLANGEVHLVTVTAAPISVFLIAGQSNGEGSTTGDPLVYNKAREQSIVCEEGQVYSTYAWSTTGHAGTVAGIQSGLSLSIQVAKAFVAESLTSNTARGGMALPYPLNSLTAAGKGKVGFDSGLAWNWNRLTGEKVWVVNCAAGSTAIEDWQPGKVRYANCVALMDEVASTLEDEVDAGHYTMSHFLYFWLQGESDSAMSKANYSEKLEKVHTNLKSRLSICGKNLEGCGNIMVRAFTVQTPSTDTYDNGPRSAQKEAIAAKEGVFADFFLASDVNDQWISNDKVSSYWAKAYPNSKYPFTCQKQAYSNPTTIAEVHTGVHYLQPGYNEIGIVAAENAMYYFMYKQ